MVLSIYIKKTPDFSGAPRKCEELLLGDVELVEPNRQIFREEEGEDEAFLELPDQVLQQGLVVSNFLLELELLLPAPRLTQTETRLEQLDLVQSVLQNFNPLLATFNGPRVAMELLDGDLAVDVLHQDDRIDQEVGGVAVLRDVRDVGARLGAHHEPEVILSPAGGKKLSPIGKFHFHNQEALLPEVGIEDEMVFSLGRKDQNTFSPRSGSEGELRIPQPDLREDALA